MVYWNNEYEVYEYVHEDGFIEIFRDQFDAAEFAKENGFIFIG